MRNRDILILLISLSLIFMVACGDDSVGEKPKKVKDTINYDIDEFEEEEVAIDKKDIEELKIDGAEILGKSDLNILYLKDGTFYGMGHHPSGDGTKIYSKYKFNFDGKIEEEVFPGGYNEAMTAEQFIWLNDGVVRRDNDEYYYLNYIDGASVAIKLDFKTMEEEIVEEFVGDGDISMYWASDDYIYYNESDLEGDIFRLDLKNQEIGFIEEPKELDTGYIQELGISGVEHKNLYYQVQEDNIFKLYEFDYQDGVLYNIAQIPEGMAQVNQVTLNRDLDNYVIFSDENTGLNIVWDARNKYVVYDLNIKDEAKFIASHKEEILAFEDGEEQVSIIDVGNKNRYRLDISELQSKNKGGSYRWYMDEDYLYAQWTYDWDIDDDPRPDKFYRISLKDKIK